MRETFIQIEDFLIYCQTKGLSIKTIKSYEQTLKLFERYLVDLNITSFKKVTARTILNYISFIQERGKYTVAADDKSKAFNHPENRTDLGKRVSTTTINNYIRNLKVFFNFCVTFDIIQKNPMEKIRQIPNKRKAKDFITDSQFQLLLQQFNLASYSEYRDYIITLLLMDTGMRITECLLIKIEDIDFTKRIIFLPSENTKGKRDRTVFYSSKMALMLKRWLKYRDIYTNTQYLFSTQKGKPIINSVYEKNFRNACAKAGIENVSPHTLRNNFAKRFLMNGGNIYILSQILGHSSVEVTEQAYLDLTTEDICENYQNYSPLARMK